jgi:excisionase family DNA binding protein
MMNADRRSLPMLLDLDGIAEHLGVTPRHVRRLVAERRIPFVKWGHLLRFDPVEIAAWLDTHRISPVSRSHPRGSFLGEEPARPARGSSPVSQRPGAA